LDYYEKSLYLGAYTMVTRRFELQLFGGALCIGFAPVFVVVSGLGPTLTAFFRCLLAVLILAPVVLVIVRHKGQTKLSLPSRFVWFGFLAGSLFALDLAVWHQSVLDVGVGMSTILANTQVLYLAGFGVLIYRERPGVWFYGAMITAIVGLTLLVGMYDPEDIGPHYRS